MRELVTEDGDGGGDPEVDGLSEGGADSQAVREVVHGVPDHHHDGYGREF